MWAAVAGAVTSNNTQYEIAVSIHDSVYTTDFASMTIPYNPNNPDKNAKEIEQVVLQTLRKFSTEHLCKFLGAGITLSLLKEVDLRDLSFLDCIF
jgi:alpha,alpha-trehalose phosphorylase (configuration-retaining)